MVGLFHVNSAALPFLELVSGHHENILISQKKIRGIPPPAPHQGLHRSTPGPIVPQSTNQNYGPEVVKYISSYFLYKSLYNLDIANFEDSEIKFLTIFSS